MPDIESDEYFTKLPPVPESEFCVHGMAYAYPEYADKLEAVYAELIRLSKFESGVIYYCLGRDSTDRTMFHFFERYRDRKASEEHMMQPVMQKLLADKYVRRMNINFFKPIEPAEG